MREIVCLLFLIIFILPSCKNEKHRIEYVYYEDGSLYQLKRYYDYIDSTKYHLIEFFQNGDTSLIGTYYMGKPDGIVKVYKQGNKISIKRRYVMGVAHGVSYEYKEQSGNIDTEALYINGKMVLFGKYFESFDTLQSIAFYYPYFSRTDTIFDFFGSLAWDKNGKIVQKMMTYFHIDAPKKLRYGETCNVNITFQIGMHEGSYFDLTLGELDEHLNFSDSTQLKFFKSDGKFLRFATTNYKEGVNLLLGKIRLYDRSGEQTTLIEDPSINEYIFYHQFEVVK